ncbi:TCR/Tet family MFS transporter [Actibacterium sp. 188UL27-1]|uniref:TCR/Tet family MFS transporter n=1 Tax=Actibacterium sp. 188UL27-1 TaxID=2786961 RepID=UPI00195CA56F|nr:TCR/Tet family MFS transporter [Actibacterium sp. 188UL27-1]MBM7066490.1 TCR/Tet family MFS transporter [Actibacterium sp. 188UL27-1]
MKRNLPITFIMITLVIDAMGIGLILPVMPDLLREVDGGDLGDAAIWGGILSTIFAATQFLCGPTLGSLSDRFGRRPVLLISTGVMAVDYLVMALAGSIWVLLLARIVGGVTSATQSTATAFIADISEPHEKTARFGLVGAAFGLGFVLGPIIGGLLAEYGTRAPFYAAAALAAMNMVLGYFVLPETVTDAIRRPFRWRRANPFGAFLHVGKIGGTTRLLILFFLYEFAFIVYPAIWAYFTKEQFGWDPRMVGVSLGSFGIAMAVVQGGLIRVILKKFGQVNTILYGFVFNFFAFFALATVANGTLALILTPLTALGAVVTPALQSMISDKAGKDAQGEMQGVVASVRSIAMILSPLVMTYIFARATDQDGTFYLPGAPFLLSMTLMVVCGTIYVAGMRERAPA